MIVMNEPDELPFREMCLYHERHNLCSVLSSAVDLINQTEKISIIKELQNTQHTHTHTYTYIQKHQIT